MLLCIRKWVEKVKERTLARQTEITQEKTQEQKDCLQSLAFLEMNLRGDDITDEASETSSRIALDQGKPGAGKSMLLKFAFGQGKQRGSPKKLITASFFFHGRGAPLQREALGLFRSLLHQILDQIPHLLSDFSSIFKKRCETEGEPGKKWEWHVTELRNFLGNSIPRASKAYSIRIYVDALDECGEEVARDLVAYFQRLTSKLPLTETTLSICFSCRHFPIVALAHGLTISVENENHRDIATYVQGELKRGISDKSKV